MITICAVLIFVFFPSTTSGRSRDVTNRLDRLENIVETVLSENNVLRQKIVETEKENEGLRDRLKVLEELVMPRKPSENIKTLRRGLLLQGVEVGEAVSTKVAFHANVNGNIGLSDNEVIKFEHTNLNLGSDYDYHLGLFQCSKPGYYVFFVHFLVLAQKRLEAEIVKNGSVIQRIFAGTNDVGNGPGSNLVIVHLNLGDRVWVKVHDKYHDTGDTLDGPWCTFAGFLLYSDV